MKKEIVDKKPNQNLVDKKTSEKKPVDENQAINKHPKYFNDAKFTCACGASFTAGSTSPEVRVEICSNCHPYYTGKSKLVDTAGRVDRFKNLLEKQRIAKEKIAQQKKTKNQSLKKKTKK